MYNDPCVIIKTKPNNVNSMTHRYEEIANPKAYIYMLLERHRLNLYKKMDY